MGTVLSVTVVGSESQTAGALADAAVAEARRWDDALTVWRPEGELARLNAGVGRGPTPVGSRLAGGLAAMLDLVGRTGGAFDPAIGAVSLGRDPKAKVRRLGAVLALDANRATLQPGAAVDPGAIGKGLAIDAMVALLREGGATAAFVDFGGSSQTGMGVPPGNPAGWTVLVSGLENGSSRGTVHLRDASLSTSRAGAVDTTPILDPRTGQPVSGPRLATVLMAAATDADAWSTALVVQGREGLKAAGLAGLQVLFEDAAGWLVTPGFPLSVAEPGK